MAKEQPPKVILSKLELKALEVLEVQNEEVVASMDVRNAETKANEAKVAEVRKSLKTKEELDPVRRRELRRGVKE